MRALARRAARSLRAGRSRGQPAVWDGGGSRARYRAVFVSDVHLGTKSCHALALRRFLQSVDCEHLYLVGDIVDVWSMKRRWYWPQDHVNVVQTVLEKARSGVHVVYVPGNHDEVFRDFLGLDFGGIQIRGRTVHVTAAGRRLLVVHGDEFDAHVKVGWLYRAGSVAYDAALVVNRWIDRVRRRLGLPYWSLAAFLKHKLRKAMRYVAEFEACLAKMARDEGLDGVVCGHIHKAAATVVDGIEYYNDGDWVDGGTALVEHADGRMEVLHVLAQGAERAAVARQEAGVP
jgi:UDP-2,3-diacylglucosamine pyrophosphatase LpxH